MHPTQTTEQRAEALFALLAGPDSIPVHLRLGKPWQPERVTEALRLVHELTEQLATSQTIPKKLALALFDITAAFEQHRTQYSPGEQAEIENAAESLAASALALLETP